MLMESFYQHEFLYYSPILVEGLHQHRVPSLPLWLRPLRGRVAPDWTPNLRRHPCTKQPQAVLDWPTFWDYVSTPSTPIVGDPKALPKARHDERFPRFMLTANA